jgi:hypothetical protein
MSPPSLWQLEEELNIYLNNGIKTFGPLLGKALKVNLVPDLTHFGREQSFPLKLVYLISGRQYIGTLQVAKPSAKRIYSNHLHRPSDPTSSEQFRSASLRDDEEHPFLSAKSSCPRSSRMSIPTTLSSNPSPSFLL